MLPVVRDWNFQEKETSMNAQKIIDEIREDLSRVFDANDTFTPRDLFENVRGYMDELSEEDGADDYFASLKNLLEECAESKDPHAYSTFAAKLFELTEVSWDEDLIGDDVEEEKAVWS